MPIINLKLKKRTNESYKIYIQENLLEKLPKILKKRKFGNKYCIITDSSTKELYGENLLQLLTKASIKAELISFTKGEKAKSLKTVEILAEKMFSKNFNRQDCILALGGGVTGDIAGFLSAIYMRGINYVQIPTSLLAMVDSSVGGKTGVNLKTGKNMLGAFKQPKAVFMDISLLKTLPETEIRNGVAEIIKTAVIQSKSLFKFLEKNIEKLFDAETKKRNHKILKKIITDSCKIKAKVVNKDEKETYLRMILNYGHTYGHAIEETSKYKIPHGQAVAYGMVIINEQARKEGYLKEKTELRIKNLLKKAGLETDLPAEIKLSHLKKLIKKDKKVKDGKINFVIPVKIGKIKILSAKV